VVCRTPPGHGGDGGGGGGGVVTPPVVTPPVVTQIGARVRKAKKGASQIVLDFNGPVGGGTGLPLSAFQLTTVPKGKKKRGMTMLILLCY